MAGSSAQWNNYDYLNAQKNIFMFDNIHEMDNGEKMYSIGGSQSDWALLSLMARLNYSYEDKYLLTATVRRDGSSRFGKNNRWGTFPSVSLAWRISQEEWFPKDNSPVNDLKLRIGYGVTGNQEIGNYGFVASYNTGVYPFGNNNSTALVSTTLSNSEYSLGRGTPNQLRCGYEPVQFTCQPFAGCLHQEDGRHVGESFHPYHLRF